MIYYVKKEINKDWSRKSGVVSASIVPSLLLFRKTARR